MVLPVIETAAEGREKMEMEMETEYEDENEDEGKTRKTEREEERALYLRLVWVEVPESLPSRGDTGYIGYIETRLCDAVVTLLI